MDPTDQPPPWSYVNFNRDDNSHHAFSTDNQEHQTQSFAAQFQNDANTNLRDPVIGPFNTQSLDLLARSSGTIHQPQQSTIQRSSLASLQGSFTLVNSAAFSQSMSNTQQPPHNIISLNNASNNQLSAYDSHADSFPDNFHIRNDDPDEQSEQDLSVSPFTAAAPAVQNEPCPVFEWCQQCEKFYQSPCIEHTLTVIEDKAILSRAWASLPNNLQVFQLDDASGVGVFAKKPVPMNCRFGPFISILVDEKSEVKNQNFIMTLKESDGAVQYLNPIDETTSNWMMFIRPATDQAEQNLAAFQQGTEIYFTTTRNIGVKEELRVWYAKDYATANGALPLKNKRGKLHNCTDCHRMFSTSEALSRHMMSLDCKAGLKTGIRGTRSRRKGIPCKRLTDYEWSTKPRHNLRSTTRSTTRAVSRNLSTCEDCTLTFGTDELLRQHKVIHADEQEKNMEQTLSVCVACTEDFKNIRELAKHVTECHGKEETKPTVRLPPTKLQCDICHEMLASAKDKIDHVNEFHKAEKPFHCEKCGKRFSQNAAYCCHLRKHEGGNFYRCSVCPESFATKSQVEAHGLSTHMMDGKFPCPQCVNKIFISYRQIRKHMRSIHSGRSFPCDVCHKVFPRADKLRLHQVVHAAVREFMCDTCGRQFGRKDKLKEHIKRLHNTDDGEVVRDDRAPPKRFTPKVAPSDYQRFIYKCQQCATGFKRRGMLINHLAKKHPETAPSSIPELNLPILRTQRNFFCMHCNRVYKSSSKRKMHILKAHPGCELPPCGKVMVDMQGIPNPSFSATVGSVTTLPLPCEYCHKQYASKAKLVHHLRTKHPEQALPTKKPRSAATNINEIVQIMQPMDGSQEPLTIALQPISLTDNRNDTDLLTQAISVNELHQTLDYQPQAMEYRLVGTPGQMSINLNLQPNELLAVPTSLALSGVPPSSSSNNATIVSSDQPTINTANSPRTTWPYFKLT